jgi:hypothetical protein
MSVVLRGSYAPGTGATRSGTYMTIDCFGFRELGLDADVEFPASLMTRVSGDGTDPIVRGSFQTVVQNWNDIIADLTLPPFQITGLDGFVFAPEHVVFDFSDSRNDGSVRYPRDYQAKYLVSEQATLWCGIYAGELQVTLPSMFNGTDGVPARFAATDMLIDDNGITGLFEADHVLPFELGDAGGWSFSVDAFRLGLEANKLTVAGFTGEIGLPICEEGSRLGYDAMIRENNEYLMRVSMTDSLHLSLFRAKAILLPNSSVTMEVSNGRFLPTALLHGNLSLTENGEDLPINIPSLDFRSLCIKTTAPYLSVEHLGYNGTVSLGNFPVSLSNTAIRCIDGRAELSSSLAVHLGDFSGESRLTLRSVLKENGSGRRRWVYDGSRLDKINLDAGIAEVMRLSGSLEWLRDDPVYGAGFQGNILLNLTKPFLMTVESRAYFGRKDDFSYWFVDGGVLLPVGIPILGPLAIT